MGRQSIQQGIHLGTEGAIGGNPFKGG
jgi:hypothetical protein